MLWWWARGMHVHNKHAEPAPDSAILAILVEFFKFLFLEFSIFWKFLFLEMEAGPKNPGTNFPEQSF
jgi:hypothetical protein